MPRIILRYKLSPRPSPSLSFYVIVLDVLVSNSWLLEVFQLEDEAYDHSGALPQWPRIFALSSDVWRTGVWVAECSAASPIPEPSQDRVKKLGLTYLLLRAGEWAPQVPDPVLQPRSPLSLPFHSARKTLCSCDESLSRNAPKAREQSAVLPVPCSP